MQTGTPINTLVFNEYIRVPDTSKKFSFLNEKLKIPSEIKVHHYEDSLVIEREKRFYSDKLSRKEYIEFEYEDVKKCIYDKRAKRYDIYGKAKVKYWNYDANGTLPEAPTYLREDADIICSFFIMEENHEDIAFRIKKHSYIDRDKFKNLN